MTNSLLDPREGTAATVANLLNDPRRSRIDDPNGGPTISVLAADSNEAETLARQLRALELLPTIRPGQPVEVVIDTGSDQQRLFDAVEPMLDRGRRDLFRQLIEARGLIPLPLLDLIERLDSLECTPDDIADQLNKTDSGDTDWTAERVRRALAPTQPNQA
jgi:hypothetical protein